MSDGGSWSFLVGLILISVFGSGGFLGIIFINIRIYFFLGVGVVVKGVIEGVFEIMFFLPLEEIKERLIITNHITVGPILLGGLTHQLTILYFYLNKLITHLSIYNSNQRTKTTYHPYVVAYMSNRQFWSQVFRMSLFLLFILNLKGRREMKVKINAWNAVATWKWDIEN